MAEHCNGDDARVVADEGRKEEEEEEPKVVGRGGLPHHDREGKPVLRVDAHTHILMEDWPSLKDRYGYGGFIRLEHHEAGKAKMFKDDGTFFREIEDNCWCVLCCSLGDAPRPSLLGEHGVCEPYICT